MKESILLLARSPDSAKFRDMVYHIMERIAPEFKKERKRFEIASEHLKNIIQDDRRQLLDSILQAEENRMNVNLSYLVWLGMFNCYSCAYDVQFAKFIDSDFEDIHTEEDMNSFTESLILDDLSKKLESTLSEYEDHLLYVISSYYCYLETIAYKYAHFAGFCLGDKLLCRSVPNYKANKSLIAQYANKVKTYLS